MRIDLVLVASLALLLISSAPVLANGVSIACAEIDGASIRLQLLNDAAHPSHSLSITLTTRADGFMIGSAVHSLAPLAAGASREVELLLPLWAPERPDLLASIIARGCCRTEVVLLPANSRMDLSHPFPPRYRPLPAAESGR